MSTVPRSTTEKMTGNYDRMLVSNVHPDGWQNPVPAGRYDLVVIGGGTAGLVAAAGTVGLGGRVALIEKYLLGGDCLNFGCVPSKAIIRSARSIHEARTCQKFGIRSGNPEPDFTAVMARMRRLRSELSFHDAAQRFINLGVDVFLGAAQFSGKNSVQVDKIEIRFRKALIATGARAVIPSIEGLCESGYLTNETIFSLAERPRSLAVIGGGPLGCELAQAFQRLGSQVTVMQRSERLLGREDEQASRLLQDTFLEEGIRVLLNCRPQRVSCINSEKTISYEQEGEQDRIMVDALLVGTGRTPNVHGLGLDKAGVAYDRKTGVLINDYLQTTNQNIYAAGDVCLPHRFTHMADATARIALQNALFPGRRKLSTLTIPRVTYTDPEIAHLGIYAGDAEKQGIKTNAFHVSLQEVDRAVLDGETTGFLKIHVKRGSDKILGATIVARHAGEMMNEISLAMSSGLGMKALSRVIRPYPTQAEAIKIAADAYNRSRLTPLVKRLLASWLCVSRTDVFQTTARFILMFRRR